MRFCDAHVWPHRACQHREATDQGDDAPCCKGAHNHAGLCWSGQPRRYGRCATRPFPRNGGAQSSSPRPKGRSSRGNKITLCRPPLRFGQRCGSPVPGRLTAIKAAMVAGLKMQMEIHYDSDRFFYARCRRRVRWHHQNPRHRRESASHSNRPRQHKLEGSRPAGVVSGIEIGAAWCRTSKENKPYHSVKLDDPSFTAPIYANLFEGENGEYNLIWSR